MDTKPNSPRMTHPARKEQTRRRLVALLNLVLSGALFVSVCAAWVFTSVANTPAVCLFHNRPWWINPIEWSAWILTPASIILGIVAIRSSKQGDRDLLLSVGILTIVLGIVLMLLLVWAEFLYFVCQL